MNIPVIIVFIFLGFSQSIAEFYYPPLQPFTKFEVYGPPEKNHQNFRQEVNDTKDIAGATLTSENNNNEFLQKLQTVESKLDNLLDNLMPQLVKLMNAYSALEPILSQISENRESVNRDTPTEKNVSEPSIPSPPSPVYGLEIPEVKVPIDIRFRDVDESPTPR